MKAQIHGKCVVFLAILIDVFSLAKGESVLVKLSTKHVVTTTSDKFLSITLGSTRYRNGWRSLASLDFQKIVNLTRELSPAYFRIGGTYQDMIYWKENGKESSCFNATQLKWLYEFAQAAHLHLIFGLPAWRRKQNGAWDPQNAVELFDYVEKKGYTMSWELGNEPDHWWKEGVNVTAEQLAKDFRCVRNILKRYKKDNNTILLGPDVASLFNDHDFFKRFLESLGNGILDAVTYHQYYEASAGAKLEDFINVTKLDGFIRYGQKAVNIVRSTQGESMDTWLGETSSTYDSGAKGFSDTYLAGFMYGNFTENFVPTLFSLERGEKSLGTRWLDKLGAAALINHTVVCRQAIFGGYYSLLDTEETMDPLPDYWTSVLHKRLVGEKVLMVENSLEPGRKARVYAHCTRTEQHYPYEAGAITLIVLNLYPNETLSIEIEDLKTLNVQQFLLEPGMESITSQSVKLNGNVLKLLKYSQLPDLNPEEVKQPFTVPPLTYGYFVIPQANANACVTNENTSF